ncbi:MAG: EpsG family protein [Oscillospiraceae bacterium]
MFFLLASYFQIFILSYFRVHIGYDYDMYAEGFLKMGIKGFSTLEYLDWEYGFNLYTKLIASISNNQTIYFGITALICLIPVAIFIYRNSKMIWLSTLLYVNLSFFYCTMNFLRQSIAIGLSLIAWEFLKKRKFLLFTLIILVASTFHSTVLILLPVYFIVNCKPKVQTELLYCYGLLFFYISSDGFIDLLTDVFHSDYKDSIFIREGLPFVYALIPIAILILTLCYKEKLIAFDSNNKYLIQMLYLSVFFMIIMSRHAILERLSYYSYSYVILLLPELILTIKHYYDVKLLDGNVAFNESMEQARISISYGSRKGILIARVLTLVILLITTVYNFLGAYAGESGIHGVFPFQTWLS